VLQPATCVRATPAGRSAWPAQQLQVGQNEQNTKNFLEAVDCPHIFRLIGQFNLSTLFTIYCLSVEPPGEQLCTEHLPALPV
jgi:hypothetical protein